MNASSCSRVVRRSAAACFLAVVSLLAGCGAATPRRPEVASVRITPGGLLLPAAGESHVLTAVALDADGHELEGTVRWTSSAPDMVSVTPDGTVTAVAGLGSALITASVDGVASFPASVLVAQPVAGAVLVPDAAVLEPVTPVPGATDGSLNLVLQGFPDLKVGDVVMGSEATPLLGRVTALTSEGAGRRVTYQALPLQEAFERLDVDLDIDLGALEPVLTDAARQEARLERLSDDSYSVTPLASEAIALKAPKCTGSVGLDKVKVSQFTTKVSNGLHFRIGMLTDGEGGVAEAHAYVDGTFAQEVSAGISASAGFNGEYGCTLTLLSIPIPIDEGLLTAVAHPSIPVGANVSVSGSLTALSAELGVKSTTGFRTKVGFAYDADTGVTTFDDFDPLDPTPDFSFKTSTLDQAKLDLEAFGGLASGLSVTVAMVKDLSIVSAKLGLQQSASLASVRTQAEDAGYASGYKLAMVGSASVGADLGKLMGWFGVSATYQLAELSYERPLSTSPKGALHVADADVAAGRSTKVSFDLDPDTLTYFHRPNVKEARLYLLRAGKAPELVDTVPTGASNQSHYQAEWSTIGYPVGDYQLAGFVVDETLSKVLALPLEVADDSRVTVHVIGACSEAVAGQRLAACSGGASSTTHSLSADSDETMTVTTSDLELEPDDIIPNVLHVRAATVSFEWTSTSTVSGCTSTAHAAGLRVTNDTYTNYVAGAVNLYPGGGGSAPAGGYSLWAGAQGLAADIYTSCPDGNYGPQDGNFEAWLFVTPQYFDPEAVPWNVVSQDDVLSGEATVNQAQGGVTTTITSSWNLSVPGVRAP